MVPPTTISLSLFWAAAVACAIAQVALLRDLLRRAPRASPGSATTDSDAGHGGRLRTGGRVGEVIWALVPAIALTLVFLWTKPLGGGASAQGVSA
jgi:hypothetical protein